MIQSRALVYKGGSCPFDFTTFSVPVLRSGEILVRIEACTLCGSDIHSVEGRRSVATPTILGHEIVGRIVETAHDVALRDSTGADIRIGDRIVWGVVAACGECFFCCRDLPQKCEAAIKYGHEKTTAKYALSGGLAEYCVLAKGTALVKLDEDIPLAVACPTSCATATVAATLSAVGDINGRSVLIVGAGMLGLTASAMAKTRGASNIICIDVDSRRLSRSVRFGATHSVMPEEAESLVRELTKGQGVDAAVELSGTNSGFELAFKIVRTGGSIVLAGAVFPNPPVQLELERIVRRNLTVSGIHNYRPRDLVDAVSFLTTHHEQFPFDELVSKWYSLSDYAAAFQAAAGKEHVRVGIVPGN